MNYMECDSRAIKCLASCIGLATANYNTIEGIDMNDIESVYEALRILRHDKPWIAYFEANIQMAKGDLATAINTLRDLLNSMPDSIDVKSTLALTLHLQNDPSWEHFANEVIEDNNASEKDIEFIHDILLAQLANKGMLTQEKAQSLKKEREIRFQSNKNNASYKNLNEEISSYSIRV